MAMFAHVTSGTVDQVAPTPTNLQRIDTGAKPLFSDYIDDVTLNACGWYRVNDPGPPAINPATQVVGTRTAVYTAQTNTVAFVYSVRAKTAEELAVDAAEAQAQIERQQAKDAIADLDTFLALPTPTNAQTLTVVRLLCRIAKRLIRDAIR